MTTVLANQLKVGDKIMPPAREVQLWMRRHVQDKGLSESALHLTITRIDEGTPDKRGPWLLFTTDQSAEWNQGRNAFPFKFKARPATTWAKVS